MTRYKIHTQTLDINVKRIEMRL